MHDAVKLAAADSGAQDQGAALLRGLDSVTVIRLFADTLPRFASPFGKLANAPWSIAQRVGAANATDLVCPPQGGDSLVMLARACRRIAQGESQAALVVGGEALHRARGQARWSAAAVGRDAPTTPNQLTGVNRSGPHALRTCTPRPKRSTACARPSPSIRAHRSRPCATPRGRRSTSTATSAKLFALRRRGRGQPARHAPQVQRRADRRGERGEPSWASRTPSS